jgi:serpin B
MGLNAIFAPGSLLGVSDSPEAEQLFVGMIIQQAFVEVNEEGTEAAAATAILAPAAAEFAPKPTPEFRADHPFVYYIQDRETGAIVFMGRMTTPEGM